MSDFVTVRTYTYSHEARLAQTLLDDAGLEPRLSDDQHVDVNPFISNAIGGVKLKVPSEHVEDARAILAEIEPEPIRPFRAGWTALSALWMGPLAFVLLPAVWIINGTTKTGDDAPED